MTTNFLYHYHSSRLSPILSVTAIVEFVTGLIANGNVESTGQETLSASEIAAAIHGNDKMVSTLQKVLPCIWLIKQKSSKISHI